MSYIYESTDFLVTIIEMIRYQIVIGIIMQRKDPTKAKKMLFVVDDLLPTTVSCTSLKECVLINIDI